MTEHAPIPRPLCDEDRRLYSERLRANYGRINRAPTDHGRIAVLLCIAVAVLAAVALHVVAS